MVNKYSAHAMLEGACFDATRLLREGDARGAFNILKHKLQEIERLDKVDYAEVVWR